MGVDMGFFGWKFRNKSEGKYLEYIRAVKREVKKSHRLKKHIFKHERQTEMR